MSTKLVSLVCSIVMIAAVGACVETEGEDESSETESAVSAPVCKAVPCTFSYDGGSKLSIAWERGDELFQIGAACVGSLGGLRAGPIQWRVLSGIGAILSCGNLYNQISNSPAARCLVGGGTNWAGENRSNHADCNCSDFCVRQVVRLTSRAKFGKHSSVLPHPWAPAQYKPCTCYDSQGKPMGLN